MDTCTLIPTPLASLIPLLSKLKATFELGKTRDIEFRKTQLKQFYKLVDENEPVLRDALLQDVGKPLVESAGLELSLFKNEVVFMLDGLDEWLAPEKPKVPEAFEGFNATIYKQPKGTCLVIG
jgi:aldehyde dehydrogenase (NAD+)